MRVKSVIRSFVLVLLVSFRGLGAAQSDLPHILVIATGGTIAGEQGEPGTLGSYEIRKPISEIVAQVPEIKRYAQVETEQFANIPSAQMMPEQWLLLARRINMIFEKRPRSPGLSSRTGRTGWRRPLSFCI